jgi:hypothetical protein
MTDTFTTQRQIRAEFWTAYCMVPGVSRKRLADGDYNTDTRVAFCDFVDALARNGDISESLAQRVTL